MLFSPLFNEGTVIKRPNECTILIIDDDEVICNLLAKALKKDYKILTSLNGKSAIATIEKKDIDVVVTDLKLPDVSGLEVLKFAKSKDEYTECIVITGFASVDSATIAIDLGVTSYLTKPLNLTDLKIQIQKAIASRLFHLKSLSMMQQMDMVTPEIKGHLEDITSLYYFTRKLMLSLDVSETMRTILEEVNSKTRSKLAVIAVQFKGYKEIFAMPLSGEIGEEQVRSLLLNAWDENLGLLSKNDFEQKKIPLIIYHGRGAEAVHGLPDVAAMSIPMMVTGTVIGSLTMFHEHEKSPGHEKQQSLFVFTSLAASVVEHAYNDMQAKYQAKTDSLTGVANHRQFHESLDREIARSERRKCSFVLVLLDIDDFKKVNDTYGHQVGDAVLVDMTKRISSVIRGGDILARYGGEEFALILSDTDLKGGMILAERVRELVASQPFTYAKSSIPYSISMGVAQFTGTYPIAKDKLIGLADKALYISKRNGKNRVSTCN